MRRYCILLAFFVATTSCALEGNQEVVNSETLAQDYYSEIDNNGNILNLTVTADGMSSRTVCYGLYNSETMIVIVDCGTVSEPAPLALLWSSGTGECRVGGDIAVVFAET